MKTNHIATCCPILKSTRVPFCTSDVGLKKFMESRNEARCSCTLIGARADLCSCNWQIIYQCNMTIYNDNLNDDLLNLL